jgi:hypothetical protein
MNSIDPQCEKPSIPEHKNGPWHPHTPFLPRFSVFFPTTNKHFFNHSCMTSNNLYLRRPNLKFRLFWICPRAYFEAPTFFLDLPTWTCPLLLFLLSLVNTFLLPIVIIFLSATTNERKNERTNGNSPFSLHVHILLTITNFCLLSRSSLFWH